MPIRIEAKLIMAAVALAIVAGCGETKAVYPNRGEYDTSPTWGDEAKKDSIFGPEGLMLFGGGKRNQEGEGGTGIGVNAYLWRASLDTVAFMPLASADPFGGVIITDWHQPSESLHDRFKLSVFILDRTLRADGVRVSVFRQTRGKDGSWVDAPVDKATATDMEDAILTRARELRTAKNAQR
ncbi:hypothetical protein FACS1894205_1630 [Alphaproteobacteria bacterium]|nr:hypothetical protein FACS1894205_1630 [Alphaproteobacteria bacterium]